MFRSEQTDIEVLKNQFEQLCDELYSIYGSKSWRLFQGMRKLLRKGPHVIAADNLRYAARMVASIRQRTRLRKMLPAFDWNGTIDISDQLGTQFSHHRSGWTYAVDALSALNRRGAVYLDCFVERTFGGRLVPLKKRFAPWAGICHVPSSIPEWFSEPERAQFYSFFSLNPAWKYAIPHCLGLFALSNVHAEELRRDTGLDVCTLYHPTEIPRLQWSLERFVSNKKRKVIQIGWWLRKMHAIFQARFRDYEKVFLRLTGQGWVEDYFRREEEYLLRKGAFSKSMLETTTIVPFVSTEEYDKLLSENIVFLDLYGSSANNAIIECIARGTPLLVNRIPAVVEYLGPSYPLYYSSYEEAEHLAGDVDLIRKGHECLASGETRKRISLENFLTTFMSSSVYRRIAEQKTKGRV